MNTQARRDAMRSPWVRGVLLGPLRYYSALWRYRRQHCADARLIRGALLEARFYANELALFVAAEEKR